MPMFWTMINEDTGEAFDMNTERLTISGNVGRIVGFRPPVDDRDTGVIYMIYDGATILVELIPSEVNITLREIVS